MKQEQTSVTSNKKKFKKHNKKPHENTSGSNSPARKKPMDIPAAIVDEILNGIHDEAESDTEPNKELAKYETTSFEEQCIYEQLMDDNIEKALSNRNDEKILEKHRKAEKEEATKREEITQNLGIS